MKLRDKKLMDFFYLDGSDNKRYGITSLEERLVADMNVWKRKSRMLN